MRKFYLLLAIIPIGLGIVACTPQKSPLAPTQIVNGKSIVIPPEFDLVPEQPAQHTLPTE